MDTAAFEKGATLAEKQAKRMQRSLEATGKSMANLGQTLSIAVTLPLVALGKTAVEAAMQSQEALASVNATLASMGNQAGRTAEQLQGLAGGIMRKSLFDDDDILRKVTNTLLTFGKVSGAVFDQAQQAAVDLSAKFGGDLQGSAIMLGKALNDPVKGLTALTRAGVSFTTQQKEQIKAMAEAGDLVGAQKLILAELEKQFGGSAEALRKANPFGALKQDFAEFQETVGAQLLKILPNITNALDRVLTSFAALSPGMQQAVVIGGVLAAALGPVLVVFGAIVTATAPFVAAMAAVAAQSGLIAGLAAGFSGLAAALGPFLLTAGAVALVATLIYKNWDSIRPVLAGVKTNIEALAQGFTDLNAKPMGPKNDTAQEWQDLGKTIRQAIEGINTAWDFLDRKADESNRFQREWLAQIGRDWRALTTDVPRWIGEMVSGIDRAVTTRLNAVWEGVKSRIEVVKGYFSGLYDAVVGHSYIPDMVDGIAAQMLRLDSVMTGQAKSATDKTKAAFQELANELRPLLDELFPEAAAANVFRRKVEVIDAGVARGDLTKTQGDLSRFRLATGGSDPVGQVSAGLGAGFSSVGESMGDFFAKLGEAGQTVADKLIEQRDRFRNMFTGTFSDGIRAALDGNLKSFFRNWLTDAFIRSMGSSLDRLADSIFSMFNKGGSGGGIFGAIGSVIGAGFGGGSGGGFGKAYASGTNSAMRGLALVGERGPELVKFRGGERVFSNRDSRAMMGRGNTTVINADFRGAEASAVASISAKLDQLDRSLEGRSVAAVGNAIDRRVLRR